MPNHDHFTRTRIKKVRTLLKSARLDEACTTCEKLCARKGAGSEAWSLLGSIYTQLGRSAEAVSSFRHVVELRPDDADANGMLANALLQQGEPEQAAVYYKKAVDNRPDAPRLLTNYAAVLMGLNRSSEAEPYLRTAIDKNPKLSKPYSNLGSCLLSQGKTESALACYEAGLRKAEDDSMMHSNYLLARHYLPFQAPQENLDAHLDWAVRQVDQVKEYRYKDNEKPDPGKKLRVGFVSPDFRTHSVAYFLCPLFENHHSSVFEIYCYADAHRPDEMTQRLRKHADYWRDTAHINDAEVERHIRNDKIDILVDLAGHTAGSRLKIFAHKPAPIQITWLGYPGTTGLTAMDYRITDLRADPSGFDPFYTEDLVRLDDCFLCYGPPPGAPPVGPAPVEQHGSVTFGSFNNLAKINDQVIKLWAEILKQAPTTRLIIKNPSLTDVTVRESYYEKFRVVGVAEQRIELKGLSSTVYEHFTEYHNVDIALDPFPYNGTTTTCEALWMGVPVLTLTGDCHAGCVGSSLLSAVGMDDWITATQDEYVACAVAKACDPVAIARQRATMRQKLSDSVLCDGGLFAARFEHAFREVWKGWCKKYE